MRAGRDRGPFAARAVRAALLGLAAAALLRLAGVEVVKVPSASMAPSLLLGDRLLVTSLAYGLRLPGLGWAVRWASPRRGDVVVFEAPPEPGRRWVKRVAGVAGERVTLAGGRLLVEPAGEGAGAGGARPEAPAGSFTFQDRGLGSVVEETCPAWRQEVAPGRSHLVLRCGPSGSPEAEAEIPAAPPERVASGHLYVLGDNRDRSRDSRSGWLLPVDAVAGRALLVLWSWAPASPARRQGASFRSERLFKPID